MRVVHLGHTPFSSENGADLAGRPPIAVWGLKLGQSDPVTTDCKKLRLIYGEQHGELLSVLSSRSVCGHRVETAPVTITLVRSCTSFTERGWFD